MQRSLMITVDFQRLCIKPGYKILDIGCGSGRHVCEASRFNQVVSIGADIDPQEVAQARQRLTWHQEMGECQGEWGTCVTDITHLPFQADSFDLVICSEILEHVHDQGIAVNEIIRVLKPNKNLVVSVPRYLPERICWALSKEYHTTESGHIRIYKKRTLLDILEGAGVQRWKHHYAHSLHTPYWWLKCLRGVKRNDSILTNLYHRFLVWDMMQKPWITRFLENLLNPIMGKSLVLYLRKGQRA